MAEIIERLDVTKNFLTIDSPIKFYIAINRDWSHRVLKSAQAIQIDCRRLLSKYYMPNNPAWELYLIYDDSLLAEGEKIEWYAHDVDFAGSTDSVNGQLVDVDLSALIQQLNTNNQAVITDADNNRNMLLGSLKHVYSVFDYVYDFMDREPVYPWQFFEKNPWEIRVKPSASSGNAYYVRGVCTNCIVMIDKVSRTIDMLGSVIYVDGQNGQFVNSDHFHLSYADAQGYHVDECIFYSGFPLIG